MVLGVISVLGELEFGVGSTRKAVDVWQGRQECRKDVSSGLALQLWYKKRKSGELDGRGVEGCLPVN